MRLSSLGIALLGAVVVAGAGGAHAAITWTFSDYGSAALPSNEQVVVDFNHPNAAGYSYTQSGAAGIFDGADGLHVGIAAPPATGASTHTMGQYEAVQTGGTFDLTTPDLSSLSVYVGSVDSYNSITFEGPNGFSETFGGAALATPANGDQHDGATNGRLDFNFGSQVIDQILFQSSGNSFEFDSIAAGLSGPSGGGGGGLNGGGGDGGGGNGGGGVPGVPEPATWTMMIGGLGLMGAALRSRGQRARASLA